MMVRMRERKRRRNENEWTASVVVECSRIYLYSFVLGIFVLQTKLILFCEYLSFFLFSHRENAFWSVRIVRRPTCRPGEAGGKSVTTVLLCIGWLYCLYFRTFSFPLEKKTQNLEATGGKCNFHIKDVQAKVSGDIA